MNPLVVWTRGLLDSGCEKLGDPPLIQWLAIQPDGQLARHTTRNQQGLLPDLDRWAQWHLIRAVRTAISPPAEDWDRRAQALNLRTAGVVIASHPHPGDDRPFNTLAAAMATALNPHLSSWWPLRGTVAWLGPVFPMIGLHASLTDAQLTSLETLAATLRLRQAAR
jgi:hypothetical protein